MAKPELGAKRHCPNCGTKFFDFNREPITCPKCGTEVEALPLARAARATAVREDTDVEVDPAAVETVSLEDVEAAEKVEAAAEDDLEVEDEPADDTFLEEEDEENDDVSGLIDSEIDPDEEG